jgi:hypothetical protein
MDRLVRDAGGTITLSVYNADGVLTDAPSTPTIVVKDGAGTTVATGTSSRESAGVYSFALTGAQIPECDLYEATWSAAPSVFVTQFEAIGGWPCSLAELRGANTELADTTRYPAALLYAAREVALDRVETVTRVAWSTRRARVTLDGDGTELLLLPHNEVQEVLAVTVDGATITPADCRLWDWGALAAPDNTVWTAGRRNITVDYLHGVEYAPGPIADAIIELALGAVVEYGSRIPERATSVATDVGTFRLTLPGRDGPTGIPRVDAVLDQYGYQHKPAVG